MLMHKNRTAKYLSNTALKYSADFVINDIFGCSGSSSIKGKTRNKSLNVILEKTNIRKKTEEIIIPKVVYSQRLPIVYRPLTVYICFLIYDIKTIREKRKYTVAKYGQHNTEAEKNKPEIMYCILTNLLAVIAITVDKSNVIIPNEL